MSNEPRPRDPSCIFCQIVEGSAAAHRIYEDDLCLAFMDLFPVSRGHLLIIPKAHSSDLFGAEYPGLEAVIRISRRLAHALRRVVDLDGIGVHQLNGAAAGQTVFHYHMHLIPRKEGEPFALHSRVQGDAQELAATAAALEEALEAMA